jgi:hypothetical protein
MSAGDSGALRVGCQSEATLGMRVARSFTPGTTVTPAQAGHPAPPERFAMIDSRSWPFAHSRPGVNIRPASKQGASTGRKSGQTRRIKNDPEQQNPRSERVGAPPGTRTPNPQIKSLLLCQLS